MLRLNTLLLLWLLYINEWLGLCSYSFIGFNFVVYWKQTGNEKIMKRITALLKDIEQHPFTGLDQSKKLTIR